MRLEQDQSTPPRLLRKLTMGELSNLSGIKVEKKGKKPKGSRFVDPVQLDEDQRSRISKALKEKKIGDEMGREIFVCALEYQLSDFSTKLERRVEPESEPESDAHDAEMAKALRTVAEQAAGLSRLLWALPDGARERVTETLAREQGLWRGYDGRYLGELSLEIDRLERACVAAGGEPEPPEPEREPEPKTDPAVSRELVSKLAGIFSDCFEMEPTAEEGGPFDSSLGILSEVTGLVIDHEAAFLAQVLEG